MTLNADSKGWVLFVIYCNVYINLLPTPTIVKVCIGRSDSLYCVCTLKTKRLKIPLVRAIHVCTNKQLDQFQPNLVDIGKGMRA